MWDQRLNHKALAVSSALVSALMFGAHPSLSNAAVVHAKIVAPTIATTGIKAKAVLDAPLDVQVGATHAATSAPSSLVNVDLGRTEAVQTGGGKLLNLKVGGTGTGAAALNSGLRAKVGVNADTKGAITLGDDFFTPSTSN